MTKTVNITLNGVSYGLYRGSEKSLNRALSMFVFHRSKSDSNEDLKETWDQLCDDYDLRYVRDIVNFDLQRSDWLD